jgi:hypothetical protein
MKERFFIRLSTCCYFLQPSSSIKKKNGGAFKMMIKNETLIDFCFIRSMDEGFEKEIDELLQTLFIEQQLYWYLDGKQAEGADIVVAELRGMSTWESEEEILHFLENQAAPQFWEYLQGYQIQVFAAKKGCGSCGSR